MARGVQTPAIRSDVLHVRVTPADAEQLRKTAAELERSVSWLLHRIIRRVLADAAGDLQSLGAAEQGGVRND